MRFTHRPRAWGCGGRGVVPSWKHPDLSGMTTRPEETPPAPPEAPERGPEARLARLRATVRLLDDAVELPLVGWKVGLDPLLGLVPGGGDVVAAAASAWIVVEAARLGASGSVVVRMLGNVAVDAVGGAIPLVGDLFDVAFRANRRNLDLLEAHLADPETTLRRSRAVVTLVTAGALLVVVGLALGVWWLGTLLASLYAAV